MFGIEVKTAPVGDRSLRQRIRTTSNSRRCFNTSPKMIRSSDPSGESRRSQHPFQTGMILKMKAEKKKLTHISKELNLSRQTVYEVLKRA